MMNPEQFLFAFAIIAVSIIGLLMLARWLERKS